MHFLFAIMPAIIWGLNPITLAKIGGSPLHKLTGTSLGFLLITFFSLESIKLELVSLTDFLLGFISGAAWMIGQYGQYISFKKIGVSHTMPVSTAVQLIGTGIIGGFILNEWHSKQMKFVGIISIIILLLGAIIISLGKQSRSKAKYTDIFFLIVTSTGYWIYSCVPKLSNLTGLALFGTQGIGVTCSGLIIVILVRPNVLKEKESIKNIFPGICFGLAAMLYITSVKLNGVTVSYLVGQLNVVISTLGGIIIFHEFKNKHELKSKIIGLTLIVVGSLLTIIV